MTFDCVQTWYSILRQDYFLSEVPPTNGIRYHYLGGGNEVGNVGCVFEDKYGTRMLLDYGLARQTHQNILMKHQISKMQ